MIEQLQLAANEADKKLRGIERARNEAGAVARCAAEAQFNDTIAAARAEKLAADNAVVAHIEAEASHPWEGKKVFREVGVGYRFRSGISHTKREEGIVEVVRRSSQFPANMRYSRPRIGVVIVRQVKKDGTASLKFCGHGAKTLNAEWRLAE